MCETALRHHLSSSSTSVLISPLLLVQHSRSSFPPITHHYSSRVLEAWDSSPLFSPTPSAALVCFSFPQCSAAISLPCAFSMTYHDYRPTFPLSIFQLLFLSFSRTGSDARGTSVSVCQDNQRLLRYSCNPCLEEQGELNPVIAVGLFCPAKNVHKASLKDFLLEINSFCNKRQVVVAVLS